MTQSSREPFRPADLRDERLIQHLAVSADGALAAYAVRSVAEGLVGYLCHLVVLELASGDVVRRTEGAVHDMVPTFAPDGRSVVFGSIRGGPPQAYRLTLESGEIEQLTSLPAGIRGLELSPDGERLLVLAPSGVDRFYEDEARLARVVRDVTWRADGVGVRDQYNAAWEVDLGSGEARRLTDPTYEVLGAHWLAGGEGVALLADLSEGAALDELPQLHVLRPGDAAPQALCTLPGMVGGAACSPGGRLAFAGVAEPGAPFWGWAEMKVYVEGEQGARELALPEGVTAAVVTLGELVDPTTAFQPQMCWLDEEHVVVVGSHRGRSHPYVLGLDGSCERLGGENLICCRVAAGGGRLACLAADGGAAAELLVLEDGELRPVSDEGGWYARIRLDPRRFSWSSPEDEQADGWLVAAAEPAEPGPLVVHIHGGPYAAHGPAPWLEMVALADAGIPVLYLNPPGSLGYGVDYAKAVTGAWGAGDEAHILAAIDAAVAAGVADPARIGVMGLSYGGFATLWLLGRHPERFAAGLCENPPADFGSWAATSDLGVMAGPRGIDLGELPGAAAEHLAASALTQLGGEVPPLLLMQSEGDLRCPPGQTDMVFTTLRRRGRDVTMVRYPEESHGLALIGRPDRRVDRMERIVGFFAARLGAGRGVTG